MYQVLENEPVTFLEKSRTMMMSWFISGYCFHMMATQPATGVVIQSQDEDRAVHDIGNMKILWEQSDPELRDRWKLARPIEKQSYNYFELANGSWAIGIPGDPNKMRSKHPSIIFLDEAAFMARGMETYNIAVATRCPKIIANSSAEVGWFQDVCEAGRPIPWPDYPPVTDLSPEQLGMVDRIIEGRQ